MRGCELVRVGVCACVNAGKREGYSEICNALLDKVVYCYNVSRIAL